MNLTLLYSASASIIMPIVFSKSLAVTPQGPQNKV